MKLRRWFRFSLRTMFVLLTLFGVALAWLGVQVKWIRDRHEAIRIRKVSRLVYQNNTRHFSWGTSYEVTDPPFPLRLFGEEGVEHIGISVPKSDPAYVRLRNLFPEARVGAEAEAQQPQKKRWVFRPGLKPPFNSRARRL